MTPSEIQGVVSAAVDQKFAFPYWAYIVALAISGIGAYLGSYLSQRGRDNATKDGFNAVRDQLKKTTQDTEHIKASLSSEHWVVQQSWSQKKQIYSDVLLQLTKLRGALSRRAEQYDATGLEHDRSIEESPHYIEWSRRSDAAFKDLEEQMGVVSIFLPEGIVKRLNELLQKHLSSGWWSICEADYAKEMFDLVNSVGCEVIASAKEELLDLRQGHITSRWS
jgi:hypothetical protein